MKKTLLFLSLLACGFSLTGCGGGVNACDDPTQCPVGVMDLEIRDPRLELQVANAPSIPMLEVRRGQNFWIRDTERLNAAWESYVVFAGPHGSMCNAQNHSAPDCLVCDYFAGCETDGKNYLNLSLGEGLESSADGSVITLGPRLKTFELPLLKGNSTAQLTALLNNRQLAVAQVHLLTEKGEQQKAYPMEALPPRTQNDPSKLYKGFFTMDAFSSGLGIGQVRILAPGSIHPSRLYFVPNFNPLLPMTNQGSRYCDPDPASDGAFDLENCRGPIARVKATPAYLKGPPSNVTWIAEFPLPNAPAENEITIEFTIKRQEP